MRRNWMMIPVALLVAACAAPAQQATPPAPQPQPQQQAQVQQQPAFDPVGTYDFSVEFQGQAIPGTLVLRRGDQGLTGSLNTEVGGETPFTRISMDGRRGELRGSTPQGDIILRLEWAEDDTVRGTWELAGMASGPASGRRRR